MAFQRYGVFTAQLVIYFGLGMLSLALLGYFYHKRTGAVKFAYTLIENDSDGYDASQ